MSNIESARITRSTGKTIYRKCECGETAQDLAAARGSNGMLYTVYKCRNCLKVYARRAGWDSSEPVQP